MKAVLVQWFIPWHVVDVLWILPCCDDLFLKNLNNNPVDVWPLRYDMPRGSQWWWIRLHFHGRLWCQRPSILCRIPFFNLLYMICSTKKKIFFFVMKSDSVVIALTCTPQNVIHFFLHPIIIICVIIIIFLTVGVLPSIYGKTDHILVVCRNVVSVCFMAGKKRREHKKGWYKYLRPSAGHFWTNVTQSDHAKASYKSENIWDAHFMLLGLKK